MQILLVGCSGFVGRELVPLLLGQGHGLSLLSRQARPLPTISNSALERLQGDPSQAATWQQPELQAALARAEAVINLAGEPIAEKRWTPAQRQRLFDSRVATTAGSDLLGRLCAAWEAEAQKAAGLCRLVILRTGIVLAADGGALGKMLPIFRAGFGGPIGSGQQWMSWISRRDFCRLISAALGDASYQGTYNAVAPEPCSMARFASQLGRALGRPSLLPVPGPILQLLLGDGAQVVLEGQQVRPERLLGQGFVYETPDLKAALAVATSPAPR